MEHASFGSMIKIVGIVVAGILGLIGLMNFANTMITSIIVRSRELAMLEAVGMTGKQQNIKLIKEGCLYYIWSVVVSLAASSVLSVTLIRALTNNVPMFDWNFTLVPELICLPFLAVLVVCIPVIAYKKISKKSVVDRLRVE